VPAPVTFFIDRCLGKAVGEALKRARAKVELHDDHFAQDVPDEDWIPEVTRRGWVILTKDKNIRRRPGEREALLTAGARIFTLTSGNMRGEDMAALFVRQLRDMRTVARKAKPPFVAIVTEDQIEMLVRAPDERQEGEAQGPDQP
jgi:predicted nuclease of predicted toxin-antitoxin system